jgi:hypothetical protein
MEAIAGPIVAVSDVSTIEIVVNVVMISEIVGWVNVRSHDYNYY